MEFCFPYSIDLGDIGQPDGDTLDVKAWVVAGEKWATSVTIQIAELTLCGKVLDVTSRLPKRVIDDMETVAVEMYLELMAEVARGNHSTYRHVEWA